MFVPTSAIRPSLQTWLQRGLALTAATATVVALGAFTSPADAGTGSEWDRLARCESGGNWQINTGNGYYGGLQFAKRSWDWAGGRQYAAYPHQATRAEQIRTAERLLDLQNLSNAWPYCSRHVGLTHAELQSGSLSDGGSDKATSSKKNASSSKKNASSSDKATSSEKSASSRPSGTYRVRSGDTLAQIASRLDVDGGWRALYRANDDRVSDPNLINVGQVLRVSGAAEASEEATTAEPKSTPAGSDDTYRVRRGDSLARIAQSEDVDGGWSALYRANDDRVSDPDLIYVGQVLRLP